MQSIKEKKLLVKFAMQMGQPVDSALVEEIKRYEEQQAALKESVSKAAKQIFEPIKVEKQPETESIVESAPQPKPDLISKSIQAIHKAGGSPGSNIPSSAKKNYIVQNYDSTNSEIYLVVATNLGAQSTNVGIGMQWREIY